MTTVNQTELQVFNFNNTKLDYAVLNNEPIFNLNNIANILNISNPRTSIDVSDKDYVIKLDNSVVGLTYNRNLNNRGELFLTEAGLYKLIMSSKKKEAEVFQKWVVKEVLPTIRKTGSYSVSNISDRVIAIEEQKMQLERAKMLERLSDNYRGRCDGRYSQILDSYAVKELTGEHILPLPERTEHYYTAEEAGKILGISANRIGRIANLNNLKNEKYGKWFIDKAKHTNKEIEAFRYNQAGIDILKKLMQ